MMLNSPDLFPCSVHIFGELKKDIHGQWFASDEDVGDWVKKWFGRQPTSFFKNEIYRLVSEWVNVLTVLDIMVLLR